MIAYTHEEDVDINQKIDAQALSEAMGECIDLTIQALWRANLPPDAKHMLTAILQQFVTTNKSFRILWEAAADDPAMYGDAASLVREQIEKVFEVALVLEDPEKWPAVFQKDGLKRDFEHYLVQRQENFRLARFADYFRYAPDHWDKMRTGLGVPPHQLAFVEYKLKNPDTEAPEVLTKDAQKKKLPQLEEFPMPGSIKNTNNPLVKTAARRAVLQRLHYEYKFICGYSHVGMSKLALRAILGDELDFPQDKKDYYRETVIDALLILSVMCAALAATEIAYEVEGSGPACRKLRALWRDLTVSSLLATSFWKLRAEALIGEPGILG